MSKRTFTTDETFTAEAEVAHFGPAAIQDAVPVWSIKDARGRLVASGSLPGLTLPTGALTPLGHIEAPLDRVAAPAKLAVTLSLKGTPFANAWDIWVYPPAGDVPVPADVVVSRAWDRETVAALAEGKKVLLLAPAAILAKSLPGSFTPVFWSPVWFGGGAGTMSILCNPKHPALAGFPTEAYTNWQWYDLLQRSRSMVLDDLPPTFRPIVQVIDNFSRNHRLGNILEARVGRGRLLLCTLNLWSDLGERPAARQMLRSLLAYLGSEAFRPPQALEMSAVDLLFRTPLLVRLEGEPRGLDGAVLRVKAAAKVAVPQKPEPWVPEADEVLARQEGFGYSVQGSTWRDSVGSAWHDAQDLVVRVTCPKGFQGRLFAHFHDWNRMGRVTEIRFQGREIGELEEYDGPGAWLEFPVTAQDSANGMLELSARPTRANTMVTELAVVR